ncbi:biotin synthetase [Salmonella enterica subsp. enterica]|nr:biotin synthetase [Salmonella enterica subsp. enterica]
MARHPRWTLSQVTELFEKPLLELLFEAQQIHRQHFDPQQVQVSTLLSIKTGACPEDCKYCPQSSRYKNRAGSRAFNGGRAGTGLRP